MIIKAVLELLFILLQVIFGWINLPDFPVEITSVLDQVLSMITNALPLIWLVLDRTFVLVLIGLVLVCYNWDKVYDFTMWIIKKLPFNIN